jgi:hypothetical protein
VGQGATVAADNGSAYGAGATVAAGHTNAAAFGAGATTQRANQQMFGTARNTYTMPGVTSGASRSAQSGPTQLVTTDANGNLASDNGSTFRHIDENQSGVAMAIAMQNPDLTGNERFGVAANWGTFESANGLGVALMGVLGHNFLSQNDRVSVSGGFGVGFEEGRGDDAFRPRRLAVDALGTATR